MENNAMCYFARCRQQQAFVNMVKRKKLTPKRLFLQTIGTKNWQYLKVRKANNIEMSYYNVHGLMFTLQSSTHFFAVPVTQKLINKINSPKHSGNE